MTVPGSRSWWLRDDDQDCEGPPAAAVPHHRGSTRDLALSCDARGPRRLSSPRRHAEFVSGRVLRRHQNRSSGRLAAVSGWDLQRPPGGVFLGGSFYERCRPSVGGPSQPFRRSQETRGGDRNSRPGAPERRRASEDRSPARGALGSRRFDASSGRSAAPPRGGEQRGTPGRMAGRGADARPGQRGARRNPPTLSPRTDRPKRSAGVLTAG
jgi:hypothetical protein